MVIGAMVPGHTGPLQALGGINTPLTASPKLLPLQPTHPVAADPGPRKAKPSPLPRCSHLQSKPKPRYPPPPCCRAADPGLTFQEGNAESLAQFPDSTFDSYTIAFGIRNVTDRDAALREALRVLKPGGR